MRNNKSKLSSVSETNLGVYVWQLPDGSFLSDAEANVLSIAAMRGDLLRISNISKTARKLGYDEGSALFLEGRRKCDDEELAEQFARAEAGLIPDPYDIGVYKDWLRGNK